MPTWTDTPTRTVDAGGVTYAYRELGEPTGTPVVFLHHFTAVLDDWDPRVLDGIAAQHHVIAFDNRGVGASSSTTPPDVERMADDAIEFIRALGHERIALFGFSLGGAVAQLIALRAPELVERIVLAGTGPRGASGVVMMPFIVGSAYLKAFLTRRDPRWYLFFPGTPAGESAATDYFARLAERSGPRDEPVSARTLLAQLWAITRAGLHSPDDLSAITVPVFVANGDRDVMVSSEHSADLARRLPDSTLSLYPDSGHGGVFQHHNRFVPDVLAFLAHGTTRPSLDRPTEASR